MDKFAKDSSNFSHTDIIDINDDLRRSNRFKDEEKSNRKLKGGRVLNTALGISSIAGAGLGYSLLRKKRLIAKALGVAAGGYLGIVPGSVIGSKLESGTPYDIARKNTNSKRVAASKEMARKKYGITTDKNYLMEY